QLPVRDGGVARQRATPAGRSRRSMAAAPSAGRAAPGAGPGGRARYAAHPGIASEDPPDMARHVQLNNSDHRALRIDTRRCAALGDDVSFAATFPAEFRDLQAHYPIVFRQDASGTLFPVALLGFQEGHNLFLDGERWDAPCLPLAIERQPFLIGRGG